MGVSWEGRSRELLPLHTRFESMAQAVCADASVNLDRALCGNYIDASSAFDPPNAQRRRSAKRVRLTAMFQF